MKNKYLLTAVLMTLFGFSARLRAQDPEANVNSRYEVECVQLSGVPESRLGKSVHDEMQKLVGQKYNQDAANELARHIRKELREYSVVVKVHRGDKPDHVKVIFAAERVRWKRFEVPIPPVIYHTKEGFSGTVDAGFETHHNAFKFGLSDTADELLERYAGYRLRYEHRKLGTDLVQLGLKFDSYHQTFNAATEAALAARADVPGIYRSRQDFAPALTVLPLHDLKLTAGTSFQRLEIQYPSAHTQTAYAGTADLLYRHDSLNEQGVHQRIRAGYGLRTATRVLNSDFVYTRHLWTADYSLWKGRHLIGVHFQGGRINGEAPLFERFSLGNSFALRGWNKFDAAPIGGSRLAYGSLEYRYRPVQVFYDVGSVWDDKASPPVRHALGFGLVFKGFFMSLGFPIRLNHVVPVFMLGFRQ